MQENMYNIQNYSSFGEWLTTMMTHFGITEKQIMGGCGVSRMTIYRWKHDIIVPDYYQLLQLLDVLNLKITLSM